MAREANTARPQKAQVTTHQVDDAWEAYVAVQKLGDATPALRKNEYFRALRDTAFARFLLAYEVSE